MQFRFEGAGERAKELKKEHDEQSGGGKKEKNLEDPQVGSDW